LFFPKSRQTNRILYLFVNFATAIDSNG